MKQVTTKNSRFKTVVRRLARGFHVMRQEWF